MLSGANWIRCSVESHRSIILMRTWWRSIWLPFIWNCCCSTIWILHFCLICLRIKGSDQCKYLTNCIAVIIGGEFYMPVSKKLYDNQRDITRESPQNVHHSGRACLLNCEDISCGVCLWDLTSHYTLVLTLAFFFLLSQIPARHSSLTDCLPRLSLQRPWVLSWPVVVPHPDTASNMSYQGCASTAVTQTCVTAPPPGAQAHYTTSVHWSASCCWGCGCDMESICRRTYRRWNNGGK